VFALVDFVEVVPSSFSATKINLYIFLAVILLPRVFGAFFYAWENDREAAPCRRLTLTSGVWGRPDLWRGWREGRRMRSGRKGKKDVILIAGRIFHLNWSQVNNRFLFSFFSSKKKSAKFFLSSKRERKKGEKKKGDKKEKSKEVKREIYDTCHRLRNLVEYVTQRNIYPV